MSRLRYWLRLWFTFDYRVGRREYFMSGVGLALLKYAGDVLLVFSVTGHFWSPWDYLSPVTSLLSAKLAIATKTLLPILILWALPFLWIGISMSMRRALDAGASAWSALCFFVPAVNYVFMAIMCLLPSAPEPTEATRPRPYEKRLPGALLAIAAGAAVGLGMLALSVYALDIYGASLFLGTPFVIGLLTAYLFNRRYPSSFAETQGVTIMTLCCVGGVLLLTAAEGAFCLLMVLPIGFVIGAMGATIGRWIAVYGRDSMTTALTVVMILPGSAVLEADRAPTRLREVRSEIVIDAPADVVWTNVIGFAALPEPSELIFRSGISYPRRAEIVGEGVGAIRYCIFSTGIFVEPITRWEPGRRLSFDVASQPPPLHEWSPYADIAPPHLDAYFRSRRGEFRLVPLTNGKTRLEGSTWYEMRLYPEAYWVMFGDAFVARIHARVLKHIRGLAEQQS